VSAGDEREFAFERVVVVLDAACGDGDAVSAAAAFARRFGAAVGGLFIEDINLFRMMTLPVARQLSLGSATEGPGDAARLETELRALSRRAEGAIAAAASAAGVKWSFHVVRGEPSAELLASTAETDLIVVGDLRPLPLFGLRLPTLAALPRAARRLPRSHLLLSRAKPTPAHPVALLEVGSKRLERVVSAALRIADPASRAIDLLVVGENDEHAAEVGEAARARLAGRGLYARVRRLSVVDVSGVQTAAAAFSADLVVLDVDSTILASIDLAGAETAMDIPLLAVR
jgi:nucleotide-binding universal stress UspA family protein